MFPLANVPLESQTLVNRKLAMTHLDGLAALPRHVRNSLRNRVEMSRKGVMSLAWRWESNCSTVCCTSVSFAMNISRFIW